jgi:hypothetical protein
VIVGSLSSSLLPRVRASSLSIMVTEGWGDLAMHPAAFALLNSYAGHDVCFSPPRQTRWERRRPEIIVPRSEREGAASESTARPLAVGVSVRGLRAPYANAVGQVVSLPEYRVRFESGIVSRVAQVELDSGEKALIPLHNLEIAETPG